MQNGVRLRDEQIAQVVAEVMRLGQQREDLERQTLTRAQVEQILDELQLPKELLDDALAQLRHKETRATEQRRKKRLMAVATLMMLALLVTALWWTSQRHALFARITAEPGRLARQLDDGGSLHTITRDGQDVVYHVTLHNVPLHEKLSLTCNWITPSGKVFRQNHWQTRVIDKAVWPTVCKCPIGVAAEPGTWQVEMALGERLLHATTFKVE